MKASLAVRPGASRGQLRVLIAMLVALLVALVAFMVVAFSDSHHGAVKTLGTPDLSIGAQAPAFAAKGVNGQAVTSASLLGKTTVLNFFGSWCPPCREETPLLARTAATHPAGVQFIGIDVRDTESAATAFLKKAGVTYSVGADPQGAITARYGVLGFPSTFLIAPDGKVEAEQAGAVTTKILDKWISLAHRG